jgi:hypothetical protein
MTVKIPWGEKVAITVGLVSIAIASFAAGVAVNDAWLQFEQAPSKFAEPLSEFEVTLDWSKYYCVMTHDVAIRAHMDEPNIGLQVDGQELCRITVEDYSDLLTEHVPLWCAMVEL